MLVPQLPEGRVHVPDAERTLHVADGRAAILHNDVIERVVQSLLDIPARRILVIADSVIVIAVSAALRSVAATDAAVIGAVIEELQLKELVYE